MSAGSQAPPLLELELADRVSLRVTPAGVLEIGGPDGVATSTPLAPDVEWPTNVVGCLATSGESALIGLVLHDRMFHVSAQGTSPWRHPVGERILNAEQLAIAAVSGGFVVIHENGLAVLDESGRERWRIDRVTFDWRFVAERDDAIWVADADANLLGFAAATGLERS